MSVKYSWLGLLFQMMVVPSLVVAVYVEDNIVLQIWAFAVGYWLYGTAADVSGYPIWTLKKGTREIPGWLCALLAWSCLIASILAMRMAERAMPLPLYLEAAWLVGSATVVEILYGWLLTDPEMESTG